MNEFGKLIDAVKLGSVEDVEEILRSRPELVHERDESGATALHFAALEGHRAVAELLVRLSAQINVFDARFGATPTGWAIEYLREMGGFLAIELAVSRTRYGEAMSNGQHDFSSASLASVKPATHMEIRSRYLPINLKTRKSSGYSSPNPPYSAIRN